MANRAYKPSDNRAGKRKDRNQRFGTRVPELGYYLIVTDTEETEKNYFIGLRDTIPAELKDRLVVKVEKAKTVQLVKRALEYGNEESQYRIPWIVFDRDQIMDFDEIIREAVKNDVNAGWSNPCFEVWLYAHFGEMPVIKESFTCCDKFSIKYENITNQKFEKADKDIFKKLVQYGDVEKAIEIAERSLKKCIDDGKRKPSEMWPACTVHRLVAEIKSKIKKKNELEED